MRHHAPRAYSASTLPVSRLPHSRPPPPAQPVFTDGLTTTRAFNETIGDAVVSTAASIGASDTDGDTLTYSLEGADAAKFQIVAATGQLWTLAGESYDYEDKSSYSVTVRVVDGNGGSDTIAVTVNVTDRDEPPLAPDEPGVSAGSTTSLEVTWTAPVNTGRPAITSYDLRYRVGSNGGWTDGPQNVSGASATIGSLTADTSYQVEVRATNDEGDGAWSTSGSGRTGTTTTEVSFESSDYSVLEGYGIEVMVKLNPAPDHRMDIQLHKTNMNGASDGDYYGIPSMLTFERGDTEKKFTFFAEPDNESDDGETVMVSFEALPAMVQKGDPSEARVTLRDNGSPSQDGITCIDHNRANIVTILSGRGEISVPGERDTWVIPGVDPYRTYFVEILGADSNEDIWGQTYGTLTLEDPHPVSYYHEDYPGASGGEWHPGSIRAENGVGRNIRFIFIEGTPGGYILTLESGVQDGTGSYHVLVRYSNYCITTQIHHLIGDAVEFRS